MLPLALAGALALGAIELDVQLLDGTVAEGRLVRLTDEALDLDGASAHSFELARLLTVSPKQPPPSAEEPAPVRVDLVGGTRLAASDYVVSAGKADVTLQGGQGMTVPTRSVASVRFKRQSEDVLRQWQEIAQSELAGDALVVRKTVNDQQTGTAIDTLDYLEGVLAEVTDESVQFDFDGDRVSVPFAKIEGLIYFQPPDRELADTLCTVVDAAGSRMNVKSLRVDGETLELALVSGPEYSLPLAQLQLLDFSAGRVVFLSDLEPISVEWKAFLDANQTLPSLARLYQPRGDRSFSGGKLQLRSDKGLEEFAKGLAIHSRSRLVYRIPDDFRRFQALAGIDPTVRTGGHVRLEIRGDNEVLLDEPVSAGEGPVRIDLDVTGVRLLKILVDFGEQLDIGDSLHFCNAKVTR